MLARAGAPWGMAPVSTTDLLTHAARVAAEHRATVGDRPVQPVVDPAALAEAFGGPLPGIGGPLPSGH